MALSMAKFVCLVATLTFPVRSEGDQESNSYLRGLQTDSLPEKRPRIIGGFKSESGRYPYYAVMNGKSLCGGVLISPRFVLTAAHCQDADDDFAIAPEVYGVWNEIDAVDRAVHPLYDKFTYNSDLAIFKLERDATKPNAIGQEVPLPYVKLDPTEVFQTGENFTVIGFGDVNPDEDETDFSSTLQQVDVNYVSNTECRRDHRGEITKEMMCAEAAGKDACYGDSGGPLLRTPNERYEDDTIVGIVSWGRGCADAKFPGVYTRISYFYDWIVGTMCVLGSDHAPDYVDCREILGLPPLRVEDLATESPTDSPTAQPTASPTVSPTARPTLTPTRSCQEKGAFCEAAGECCTNRCNVFKKICVSEAPPTRARLSSGMGGSAGGANTRGKLAFLDLP